jgi:uncharacterized membrane protein
VQNAKPTVNNEIEEGKIFAFFSYWGILFLIPLLAKKDNKFAMFHCKQGLVHFVVYIAIGILGMIPIIGWFIILPLGGLIMLIFSIIGMVKSLSGEYWKSPIFGNLAAKLNL